LNVTAYTIQLPVYEGPLDLLLELIERAELDITKVALAAVTDQYIAYLHEAPELELSDLASFLVIAAKLLQIKSEALLPQGPVREPDEEDPGEALAEQLIAYKMYKAVAGQLRARQEAGQHSYLRLAPPPKIEPKLDLSGLEADDLYRAMIEVLASKPSGPSLDEVVSAPRVRIRDQIRLIFEMMRRAGRASFQRLLRQSRSRLEIVVSFLAVLELIKLRRITVQQDELFGDIELLPGENWRGGSQEEADLDLEFDE
jgi:segregation and condensation protein A